jgi:hypothetical protein
LNFRVPGIRVFLFFQYQYIIHSAKSPPVSPARVSRYFSGVCIGTQVLVSKVYDGHVFSGFESKKENFNGKNSCFSRKKSLIWCIFYQ